MTTEFALRDYALGSRVCKNIATHMEMAKRVTYFSIPADAESQFLNSLASQSTGPLYFHECFPDVHPVVFDVDAKPENLPCSVNEIVTYLQTACRDFFDLPQQTLRCVVVAACSASKSSYHVHFPFIAVDRNLFLSLTHYAKQRAHAHDRSENAIAQSVDQHLCTTRKLRMALSDKFDKERAGPAGRPLRINAAFDAFGRRDDEWTDALSNCARDLLDVCSLRRFSNHPSSKVATRRGAAPHVAATHYYASDDEDVDMDETAAQPPYKRLRAELCKLGDRSSDASSDLGVGIDYDTLARIVRSETPHTLPERYFCDLNAISRTVSLIRDRATTSGEDETAVLVHFMNIFCCAVTDLKGGLIYCIRTCRDVRPHNFQRFHFVQKNNQAFLQYFESIRFPVETRQKHVMCHKNIAHIWLSSPLRRNVKRIIFDPSILRPSYEAIVACKPGPLLTDAFLRAHTHIDGALGLSGPNVNLFDHVSLPVAHALRRCLHTEQHLDWTQAVGPILHHMHHVWCSGNAQLFSFLLGWFKHVIFRPWEKTGVAVVLHGSEGCGKSSVITHIGKGVFGEYFYQITDNEDLTGRFANALADKLLVFLDEALWGGNKKDAGKVKALLTEKHVRVEFKGVDAYYVDNFSNFILASNDIWLVPAGANARRWFCLDCSPKYNRNSDYFAKLIHALTHNNHFGVSAFVTHLHHHVSFEQFTPHAMPVTELLRIQKEMGLSVMETWWFQVLNRGYLVPAPLMEQSVLTDPTFPHAELRRVKNSSSPSFQCAPLEIVFNLFRDEMYGGVKASAAISADKDRTSRCIQRFLQSHGLWQEVPSAPPSRVHGMWLCFDINQAKNIWRIRYEDAQLVFNSDVHRAS